MNAQLSFPTHMCEKVKAHSTAMSLHWNTMVRRHIRLFTRRGYEIRGLDKIAS